MVMAENLWDQVWTRVTKPTFIGNVSMIMAFKILDTFLSDVSRKNKVIDFGCGSGITLSYLRKQGFSSSIGIDNSKVALKLCEQKGFVVGKDVFHIDATETPFSNGEFNLVFAWGLLEHFSDFNPFVDEMCRVSVNYIVLVQPNAKSFCGKAITKLTCLLKRGVQEYSYNLEDFVEAFEKRRFWLVQVKSTLLNEFDVLMFARSEKVH